MRKTKIICTLGPSTDQEGVLRELVANGMNVARFNFSHGSHEEHLGRFEKLKAIREELGKPVAALLDTKGPEIRLKDFKNGTEMLEAGQTFTLTTREVEGTKEICSITYKDLPQDVQPGGTIMLDDGLIKLQIVTVNDTDIVCKVLNNGKIKNKKGVNVPGVHLSMPYMSQRDRDDIIFGAQQGFDFIAASFVRTAQDVYDIRNLLNEYDSDIRIIAKIENREGVNNIDSILAAADAVMVARGDLGVEIDFTELPGIQKNIIERSFSFGKPIVTATQMLDSMIVNPRPTRAEISDVANAIYDGTSAIMLSGETAAGAYPVEALKTMSAIAERTENEDGTWTVKTDTQTLTEQEDGTWKLTGLEGSGSGTADGGTSFVRNIEETYKADEVEVTDNGIDWSNAKKLPTASIDLAKVKAYAEENKDLLSCLVYKTAEFTPEKESGSIDMDYTFNSNDVIDRLSGETKNLVVFEVMFKGSIENASDETPVSIVASECDKDNEGQTVKLAPSTIGTTATDKSDGDHELMAGKDAVITDEVKYEGLIPGKEYTLHATLMDKKTGEPLKVADKGVTAELKFTPNSESGTVSINLGEFDATSLDGHTLVVFEELTKQSDIDGKTTDVTVAEHKDINDEGQSVTVTSTPAGSTYGKTGVDMTNIAIAIGILLIAAGCATAYGIKSRKTTKGDADESAEDNTEA